MQARVDARFETNYLKLVDEALRLDIGTTTAFLYLPICKVVQVSK